MSTSLSLLFLKPFSDAVPLLMMSLNSSAAWYSLFSKCVNNLGALRSTPALYNKLTKTSNSHWNKGTFTRLLNPSSVTLRSDMNKSFASCLVIPFLYFFGIELFLTSFSTLLELIRSGSPSTLTFGPTTKSFLIYCS